MRMKAFFYTNLDKTALIQQVYITERSEHSPGHAVDLTPFKIAAGKDAVIRKTINIQGIFRTKRRDPGKNIQADSGGTPAGKLGKLFRLQHPFSRNCPTRRTGRTGRTNTKNGLNRSFGAGGAVYFSPMNFAALL